MLPYEVPRPHDRLLHLDDHLIGLFLHCVFGLAEYILRFACDLFNGAYCLKPFAPPILSLDCRSMRPATSYALSFS